MGEEHTVRLTDHVISSGSGEESTYADYKWGWVYIGDIKNTRSTLAIWTPEKWCHLTSAAPDIELSKAIRERLASSKTLTDITVTVKKENQHLSTHVVNFTINGMKEASLMKLRELEQFGLF